MCDNIFEHEIPDGSNEQNAIIKEGDVCWCILRNGLYWLRIFKCSILTY